MTGAVIAGAGTLARAEVITVDGFRIRGGRSLSGTVWVSGAKNAALPVLAATVLAPAICTLHKIPDIRDIQVMFAILNELGARIQRQHRAPEGDTYTVDCRDLHSTDLPEALTRQMRSSVFLLGPLVARFGHARVSYPGGCVIGPRPIDLHLAGLRALGVRIEERGGFIEASAERLRGVDIHLDVPSVGATEHLMMAAAVAEGRTVIHNAAREPEIVDLQRMLVAMGARVRGAGSYSIIIDGVEELHGAEHTIIPDRIEAGTFLLAGAITGGEVCVTGVVPEHLEAVLAKLREAGASIRREADRLTLRQAGRPRATNIKTQPYPGFPTDLQNPFLALMSIAEGTSVITETVWGNRFRVVEELRRMGADVQTEDRVAIIRGVPQLSGAEVQSAEDLRGGAALVLAALAATGESRVLGARYIDRGYAHLAKKLRLLGADIERD